MDTIEETLVESLLEKVLEKTMIGIKDVAKNRWESFKTKYKYVFSLYFKSAYKKYSVAKTVISKSEPIPLLGLNGFFVNPEMRYKERNISVDGIDTITSLQNNHILFQGTGGIGKTTLLKYLFIDALSKIKKPLVPIFVELYELNGKNEKYNLSDFFFSKLKALGSNLNEAYMERTLEKGIYLFLLDGYDEIGAEERKIFKEKLNDFISLYSGNIVVMTSRPFSDFIDLQGFTVIDICPFSQSMAITQIHKIEYNEKVKMRFIRDLKERLYIKHSDFASNPLLISIMLLTYDNFGEIPDKLHKFYSEAFDTMFEKHESINGVIRRQRRSKLTYDGFREAFAYFCFYTYVMKRYKFTRDYIRNIFSLKKELLSFDIDDFLYDLQNILCIFIKEGNEYTFLHRSFQEYFAAVFLQNTKSVNPGRLLLEKDPEGLLHDSVFPLLYDMDEVTCVIHIFSHFLPDGKDREEEIKGYIKRLCSVLYFEMGDLSDYSAHVKNLYKYGHYDFHIMNNGGRISEGYILLCIILFIKIHTSDKVVEYENLNQWEQIIDKDKTDEEIEAQKQLYIRWDNYKITENPGLLSYKPLKRPYYFQIAYSFFHNDAEAMSLFMKTSLGKAIRKSIETVSRIATLYRDQQLFEEKLLECIQKSRMEW